MIHLYQCITLLLFCERPRIMLASLALISLLQAPALGADGLTLANPHLTHGALGPVRTGKDVKPGDTLYLAFEIQGLSTDATGKATYSTAVEVTEGAKSLYKQPARKYQEFLPLGGGVSPAFAQVDLGIDSHAGDYVMHVTVTDTATGKSQTIKQPVTVAPRGFDIVHLSISGDAAGLVPIGAYAAGQPFWVHAAAVGFERSTAGTKQPKVDFTLSVLGADGLPIVKQPFSGTIDKDVPINATALPVNFFVPLNRPGTFTLQLTARDGVGKGSSTVSFPITVVPAK